MHILNKLREKKGAIMMIMPFFIFFMVLFIMLLLNIGGLYLSRNQAQAIADAASRGGAYMGAVNGKYAENLKTGEVRIVLDQPSCESYAKKIIAENNKLLKAETQGRDNISNSKFNPYGKVVFEYDGKTKEKTLDTQKQYYAGAFTVYVTNTHKPIIPSGMLSRYDIADKNIEVQATTIVSGHKK